MVAIGKEVPELEFMLILSTSNQHQKTEGLKVLQIEGTSMTGYTNRWRIYFVLGKPKRDLYIY